MDNITPIIVAFVMAIPGIITFASQMKKDRVDAARLALDMAEKLDKRVKELEELNGKKDTRIEELECKVEELENENKELRLRLDAVESTKRPKPRTGG